MRIIPSHSPLSLQTRDLALKQMISSETAMTLKSCGLPQPKLVRGQFWYAGPTYQGGTLEHRPLCVVVEQPATRKLYLRRFSCERYTTEHGESAESCYVPTVQEMAERLLEDEVKIEASHTQEVEDEVRLLVSIRLNGEIKFFRKSSLLEALCAAWICLQQSNQ